MLRGSRTEGPKSSAIGNDLAQFLPDDDLPWYKKRHLLLLNYYVLSMCLLSAANGYDGSMMNGLMALPQWHEFMGHPKGAWLGFINAIQPLSATFVAPVVAYVANRWGRKKGLLVGYFFLLLGALLQAFTPSTAGFVVSRFFLGQPTAWWGGIAPLLITEIAYPTHRALVTALFNTGWYIGSLVAAWATFGTRNVNSQWAWRIPSLLQIAIPLLVLPGILFTPESPRYLVSKGQSSKAREVLTKFHAGGQDSRLVDFQMSEVEAAIEADNTAASNSSWSDLFSTRGNRHRALISITLGVFAQWNGAGVVSYYLALVLQTVGITSVTHQTLISGCLQIWNLFFAVAAALSVDRVGRRPLFLVSAVGMLVSYIIISGLSGSFATTGTASVGLAVVPFLFVYYGFYDIAFTPLLVAYPAEIWPYHLRARGVALTQVSTASAVSFNIFINPIALDAIGWKYYIVFAIILVFITVTIYFYYPETRGHSLEEMVVVFDGAEAATISHGAVKEVKDTTVEHKQEA